MLRKILTTGMGAALMTEEGIRDYIGRQIQKAKEELIRTIIAELKKFLEHVDLPKELNKALSSMTVEVQASIRLVAPEKGRSRRKILKSFKITNT